MKKISIIILISFSLFNFIFSQIPNFYSKDQIFTYLNSLNSTTAELSTIIDSLISTFNEAYAFNEIAKNPPKYKNADYFSKVNFQESLQKIDITSNTNLFHFYRQMKKVIDSLEDYHIQFDQEIFPFAYLRFMPPIYLKIEEYERKPRVFGAVRPENQMFNFNEHFKNNETVFKVVQENLKVPIKSINGKEPFEFISSFGGDFCKLRSKQGTFRHKYEMHNSIIHTSFYSFPLSYEDFKEYTVIYENNQTFTTEYIFVSPLDLTNLRSIILNKKSDLLFNKEKEGINSLYYNFLGKNNFNFKKYLKDEQEIKWDYNYNDMLMCKTDNKNEINIYGITGFSLTSYEYLSAIINCTELFDSNTYPVVLVNLYNNGGYVPFAQILLELISPKMSYNFYGAIRNTKMLKDKNGTTINALYSLISDLDNCNDIDYNKLSQKTTKIDYGKGVKDTLTTPFSFTNKALRDVIESEKLKLKNPRNPTDILIFTDGFTFSAGGIFTKFMQYYGGGITVGYFPDPNIDFEKIPFDSGLSPTSILTHASLVEYNPTGYETLYNEHDIAFAGLPFIQIFYSKKDLSRPLEYEVTPVDEIVNLYDPKSNYESFVNESFRIINKYKTNCNPNNKKLLLITDECDKSFKNNYTHGGYECGNDGKWTKKCVSSYCELGYIFDHDLKKCIKDICSDIKVYIKDDEDDGNDNHTTLYIIFAIVGVAIILLVIFIIIKMKRKEGGSIQDKIQRLNNEEMV